MSGNASEIRRPDALFLALAGAGAFIFGQPNTLVHIPWLAPLLPCALLGLALRSATPRQAFLSGWFSGMAAAAGCLYWLVYPMHDVAGMSLPLATPVAALLVAYLACYTGLSCLGMFLVHRFFAPGRGFFAALLPPLFSGLAFAGFEVLCGTLLTGFPWLTLGAAFAFTPTWTQGASLVGGHMLGGIYAAGACLVFSTLPVAPTPHLTGPDPARRVPAGQALARLALGLALLLGPPLHGHYRLSAPPDSGREEIRLILAQGNVNQNEKWDEAYQEGTLDLYLSLSEQALASLPEPRSGPLLVLWPETAMPFYYELHADYARRLQDFARNNAASLAFGSLGVRDASGLPGLFNRMYLITPEGKVGGFYDKEHLVPFGEYMPFAASIPYLDKLLQFMNFTSGRDHIPLRVDQAGLPSPVQLGVLICYEAIFPALAQERVAEGATLLVNISNDGWFRKSSAPLQHFSHAILRAVEQARPLVRGTNTGISAVVDSHGRVTTSLDGLFVKGWLTGRAAPSRDVTLYHRLHPLPEILLAALALFSLFGYRLRRRA